MRKKKQKIEKKPEENEALKHLRDLKQKYDIQKIYTEKIETRMKELEKQVDRYKKEKLVQKEEERKFIMKDKEIKARDILIKQMQFELKKQKDLTNLYNEHVRKEQEFNTIMSTGKLPVIVIENFTKEDIDNAHKEFSIKDHAVYFKNFKHSASALKTLTSFKPKVILNKFNVQHIIELKRARMIDADVTPAVHEFYGSVDIKHLQEALDPTTKKEFEQWLSSYRTI